MNEVEETTRAPFAKRVKELGEEVEELSRVVAELNERQELMDKRMAEVTGHVSSFRKEINQSSNRELQNQLNRLREMVFRIIRKEI